MGSSIESRGFYTLPRAVFLAIMAPCRFAAGSHESWDHVGSEFFWTRLLVYPNAALSMGSRDAWHFNSGHYFHGFVSYRLEPTRSMVGLAFVCAPTDSVVYDACYVCDGFIQG